ncbi:butyrophilin-like protein 10 isoform X2 [Myripristis murdjan]|uniref:butyrophilin-like protein 10 isoform X2 n=1 Tax=Myripristis murdjan TaxID=586833 RepID=UPI001175E230|nr:butyrophilin-like protein 10 isoform X2 [Myripristis murdjan]
MKPEWFWTVAVVVVLLGAASLGSAEGKNVTSLEVREGHNVTLPCVLPTKEDISDNVFDWKKDNQKEMFLFSRGDHYNNRLTGQDQQFSGRVSFVEGQLRFGDASVTLSNAKMADSGLFSCHFPHVEPRYTAYVRLSVISAAPRPHTKFVDVTEKGVELRCEVGGAYPQPEVEWQDSKEKALPAAGPMFSTDSEGRYHVILSVYVTASGNYTCIARQKDIGHKIDDVFYVHENLFSKDTCTVHVSSTVMTAGLVLGWVVAGILALYIFGKWIKKRLSKESSRQEADSPQAGTPESSNSLIQIDDRSDDKKLKYVAC